MNIVDSVCVSCGPDHVKSGSTCVKCNTPTEYIKDETCLKCPSPCSECTLDGICLICQPSYYLTETTNECLSCATNCKICSSASACTQCNDEYVKNENLNDSAIPSKTSDEAQCVSITVTVVLAKTTIDPATVSLVVPDESTKTNNAVSNYEEKIVQKDLPFTGIEIENCRIKNDLVGCTFCEPGFVLVKGYCLACPKDCIKCLSVTECTKCKDNFNMVKNPDTNLNVCQATKVRHCF